MKPLARTLLLFLTAALTASYGDGKFFLTDRGPTPGIPFQRACIVHADGMETLLVQTAWEVKKNVSELGWVVPVPARPELGTMNVENAGRLFQGLAWRTRPNVANISDYITAELCALILISFLFAVLYTIYRLFRGSPARKLERIAAWCFYPSFIIFILFVFVGGVFSTLGSYPVAGVNVLADTRIGVYDVKVVAADDAGSLVDWLNEHGFGYGDADRAALDDYLSRGWCFVTARATTGVVHDGGAVLDYQGLTAPLLLRFPSDKPVYPLVLTGTAGTATEITCYVYARHRGAANPRFTTDYACPDNPSKVLRAAFAQDSDASPFAHFPAGDWFLTKYQGKLEPADMATDLVVERAPTDEPYRKTIWRW